MEGTGFKSIFVFLLLALLAFVAGSLASDSARDALVPSLIVVGLFFLVFLGKNCWALVLILPPILQVLEFPILQKFPVIGALSAVMLFYWFIMSVLGYVKFTWNGNKYVDAALLIFFAYFLFTWVRHPVTVLALVSKTDFSVTEVGGQDYIFCLGAICYYLFLSVIPLKLESVLKVLKIAFWISLVVTIFMCVKGLLFGSSTQTELLESATSSRFGAFAPLGLKVCYFLFAKYTFIGIIISPWKLILVFVAFVGIALSGFRTHFMQMAVYIAVASLIHKRLLPLLFSLVFTWAGCVILSNEGAVDNLPYGIQRVLSSVPGVDIKNAAASDAEGSLEWRYEMWKWAFNPATGYIKDYVFGDGYGYSLSRYQSRQVASALGLVHIGDNRFFAEDGLWHSGYITTIHRVGYVGLVLVVATMIVTIVNSLRLCFILRLYKNGEYALIYLLSLIPFVVSFFVSAGSFSGIFNVFVLYSVLSKLISSILYRNGEMLPMFKKTEYVPMIQSNNRGNISNA